MRRSIECLEFSTHSHVSHYSARKSFESLTNRIPAVHTARRGFWGDDAKENAVKNLVIAALVLFPLSAGADHLDVIKVTLKDDCTLEQYVAIANDFNEQWGTNNGYRSEVAVPVQNEELVSIFWLGRTASAEAFGKAWDTWRNQLTDPKSLASKLNARFVECSDNTSRSGFDLY